MPPPAPFEDSVQLIPSTSAEQEQGTHSSPNSSSATESAASSDEEGDASDASASSTSVRCPLPSTLLLP